MTDPTPQTPAEIAEIIKTARKQNGPNQWICFCPDGPKCGEVDACKSFAALLACAERGIAPPSGEVEWALGYLDSIAIRVHDIENEREKAFDILRRLSAPPVAAPSGEAAPREGEVAELLEAIEGAANCPAANFVTKDFFPRISRALRTLSEGKAAAEARADLEKAARESETRRAEMERGFKEAQIEGHKYTASKLAASESRRAALERETFRLCEMIEEWADGTTQLREVRNQVSRVKARAALSSAETAKPGMPECVRELMCEAMVASNSLYAPMETAERILAANKLASAHAAVKSYYAKPSATAGEGGE